MMFLLFVLATAGVLWSIIDNRGSSKGMADFCKLECKQNIKSKYKFCC